MTHENRNHDSNIEGMNQKEINEGMNQRDVATESQLLPEVDKTERQKANEAKRMAKLEKFKAKQEKQSQEKQLQEKQGQEKSKKKLEVVASVEVPQTPVGEKKGMPTTVFDYLVLYLCLFFESFFKIFIDFNLSFYLNFNL
jgi:hypothetical protein